MENAAARRNLLWSLLGDLPPRDHPVTVLQEEVVNNKPYDLTHVVLDLNGIEHVPAYIVRPKSSYGKQLPVVIYNHAHGGDYEIGKNEFISPRSFIADPPYAQVCAENGWVGVCIDTWNFGERRGPGESHTFKKMLWHGQVLWGMMVYDSIRLVDYLSTLPFVDSNRIAAVGLSMGSTMSWWMAALDERIKACVDICCLTDFDELIKENGLDRHGLYYYVPGLLKHFNTAQINALIAPRAHLSLAGSRDPLTPQAGLKQIDEQLKQAYADAGAAENWKLVIENTGHNETPEMRREIVQWLKHHL
jgi:hypothetical protein